ncbi:chromate transporter [Saccharospirillum sp.]|uniref:chromate transporter n=1 Tax=Saccharospirillum sp. TaxID=2033801 RepID=UPI0034A01B30
MDNSVGFFGVLGLVMLSTLFSIGGGNGQVAMIQGQWVSNGLLDPALFAWAFALGHFTPGPKVSFVTAIGYYMAGIPGALAAMIGIVIPTSVGASLASHWYQKFQRVINYVSISASMVIAGMMTTAAVGLALPLEPSWIELAGIALVTFLIVWRRPDPILIILGSGTVGAVVWFVEASL